jgi:hypothetical protein
VVLVVEEVVVDVVSLAQPKLVDKVAELVAKMKCGSELMLFPAQ